MQHIFQKLRCIIIWSAAVTLCYIMVAIALKKEYIRNMSVTRYGRYLDKSFGLHLISTDIISVPQLMSVANSSATHILQVASSEMPSYASICPRVPEGAGPYQLKSKDEPIEVLEARYKNVSLGGWWKPEGCFIKWHVAIVIPFRDREPHLRILLNNLHPFLQKQRVSYRIFVIEQVPPVIFNRAMLMNIGFKEAQNVSEFDCFIFHDVDLIPEDLRNLYTCGDYPRHMAVAMNKFGYSLPYGSYFGGVCALTKQHMLAINGMTNVMFGWGGEDDNLYARVKARFPNFLRYPPNIARYTMVKHVRDKSNPGSGRSFGKVWALATKYKKDGLSTLKYRKRNVFQNKLFTKIVVSIDGPTKHSDIPKYLKYVQRKK